MTAQFIAAYETPTDVDAFDRHYVEVHIPLARRLPGLRRYTVGRDVAAVRGDPPYYLVAQLEWDTMDDLRAAFASPEGRATAADAAHLGELAQVRSMVFVAQNVR
jgi:uncharacterized protein (TIGR02118 family)